MSVISETRVVENSKLALTCPIPPETLAKISDEVCSQVFESKESSVKYDHDKSSAWNNEIIQLVLKGIEKEASAPSYKYIVYVTIVERLSDSASVVRGIRTSSGAFWNADKDGMWNHKWSSSGGTSAGVDVVFSIAWINCSAPQ